MLYDRPVRELMVQAVAAMPTMFRQDQIVVWFKKNFPAVKPDTVKAHVTAATVNSKSRHHRPSADQHLLFKRSDGYLEHYDPTHHGHWDDLGEPMSAVEVVERANPLVAPNGSSTIASGQQFEVHAARVCSDHWVVDLKSAVVELARGMSHQFDLVSADGRIVGDAKWFKNIPTPAAKWSVIAEYVWLLQHLKDVDQRFIVFGQDREVPERWLKRFRPLTEGVDFYFLTDDGSEPTRI